MLFTILNFLIISKHLTFLDDEVTLNLEGLLRGWDLPLFDLATSFAGLQRTGCPYLHITGWGDFPLRSATWTEYKSDRKPHQPVPQMFNWRATSGPDEHITEAMTAAWDNFHLEDGEESDAEYDESGKDYIQIFQCLSLVFF